MTTQLSINILSPPPPKLLTLNEFLDWYPEDGGRFELRDGVIFAMQATGTHEQVAGFLALELGIEIKRQNLPFFIPRQGIVKAKDSDRSGFIPDVFILNADLMQGEPLWKPRSTIVNGETIPLAIEVVSSNWQDDYLMKLGEYEKLGIKEYWIVDYLGLGGRRYIGTPKQPTISIYALVEGEYGLQIFRGKEKLKSLIFPELNLVAQDIFAQGQ